MGQYFQVDGIPEARIEPVLMRSAKRNRQRRVRRFEWSTDYKSLDLAILRYGNGQPIDRLTTMVKHVGMGKTLG
ncbi:hypothetical protein TNCV_2431821 [Trichonephila clavipes]|nr:hypothetical protein TNCV_2431821 [Trichonephila clavipes]